MANVQRGKYREHGLVLKVEVQLLGVGDLDREDFCLQREATGEEDLVIGLDEDRELVAVVLEHANS